MGNASSAAAAAAAVASLDSATSSVGAGSELEAGQLGGGSQSVVHLANIGAGALQRE